MQRGRSAAKERGPARHSCGRLGAWVCAMHGRAGFMTTFEADLKALIDGKTGSPGTLGRLERLAAQAARVHGRLDPVMRDCALTIFAADHGIAEEGVSAFPQAVTRQMVLNFPRRRRGRQCLRPLRRRLAAGGGCGRGHAGRLARPDLPPHGAGRRQQRARARDVGRNAGGRARRRPTPRRGGGGRRAGLRRDGHRQHRRREPRDPQDLRPAAGPAGGAGHGARRPRARGQARGAEAARPRAPARSARGRRCANSAASRSP